ncbi:MAG: hypothetical protein EA366_11340 [Spirulina sp. DLM2.Bin59]|nr:MAG: hypothetical protein EA366_11340 [Spirulina sp. DLM2.Bin59]
MSILSAVLASSLLLAATPSPLAQRMDAHAVCNPATTNCFEQRVDQLIEIVAGCVETRKVDGPMTYTACTQNGELVSAAEFLTEEGDGVTYWLVAGEVVAIRFPHNETLLWFKNGRLVEAYEDGVFLDQFSELDTAYLEVMAEDGVAAIVQMMVEAGDQ